MICLSHIRRISALLLAFAFFFLTQELTGQQSQNIPTPWQIQSPLPAPNVIRKASFVNERLGWAVGRDTVLLKTSDGGSTWEIQQQSVLPRNRFSVIQFFDVRAVSPQVIWAMANAGVILSRDGGATWTRTTDGGNCIFALSDRYCWVGDDDLSQGIVRRTRDGGQTWQTSNVSGVRVRDMFFLDSLQGWAVGGDGIATTSDGGATWTTLLQPNATTLGGSTRFTSTWRITPQIGFVGAEDSTLIRTTDGGRSWQRASLPTSNFTDITALRMISAQMGFALAEGNVLLASTDSGKTWLQRSIIPASTIVTDVQFVNEQIGFAVGGISFNIEESSVWRTSDGGRTWEQIRGTKNMPLYGIAARSANSTNASGAVASGAVASGAVAAGATAVGNTTILATENGGQLWQTQLPLPGNADNFAKLYRSVSFVSPTVGYIAGEVGRILKTSDAGRTWIQPMQRRSGFDWYDCSFANEITGWVVGANTFRTTFGGNVTFSAQPVLSRTTDGGATWTEQTLPQNAVQDTLQSIDAVSETIAFAVGNRGGIYATQNGGTTWTRQTSPTTTNLYGVFFLNAREGWAVGGTGESAVIVATNDGGATWRRQLAPADGALRSVFFVNSSLGYAVGMRGTMLVTRNGGALWEIQDSRTAANLNDVVFVSAVKGWAVGDNGAIVATQNGGFTPRAQISAQTLDFGRVAVGDNAERTVTISAEYLLAPLTITAPAGFQAEFAGQRGQSITLLPNELASTQAIITLRFLPTRDGEQKSTVRIESPFIASTVEVSGFGVQRPVLRFSPEQQRLSFAPTRVGEESTATITVQNVGVSSGTISLAFSPIDTTARPQFSGLPQTLLPIVLQPNQTESLQLRFNPRSFGMQQTSLEVRVRGGSFDTTYRVTLIGTGLQAVLQAQPPTLDIGSVSLTQSTVATIGFTNVGNISSSLRRVFISPAGAFSLASPFAASELAPLELAPRDILSLSVRFTPTALGFNRATLFLVTDGDTLRTILLGTGVPLLDAPTLVSPYNGRINTPVSALFAWRQPAGALAYDVQISRDSNFVSIDAQQTALRSLSFSPTIDLLNSTRYFWRVRARNQTASSDWSAVFNFTTIRPNPLLRSSEELIQPSGIVGQSQRGYFSVRSSVRDTIVQADFRLLNDDNSYSLRLDQFPLPLRANVTESITYDFLPRQARSGIRGILRLISRRDTLLVPFLGEGFERDSTLIFAKVAVQTDRTNASAGDSVSIKIVMTESQNLDVGRNRGKAQSFNALLRIRNESVLSPSGRISFPPNLSENLLIGNGGRTIVLSNIPRLNSMKSGVLAEIPATVLLGDASSTAIEFLSFAWTDTDEQQTMQTVVDSALATIVCTSGGTPRFIQRRQAASIQALAPNPVHDVLHLNYSLLESGATSIFLVDMLGKRMKTLLETNSAEWGTYSQSFDMNGLPGGVYLLVLQSPAQRLERLITILR